jgi:transposase
MTDRAGRWETARVGRPEPTVSRVAGELGCDWHTVNDTVNGPTEAVNNLIKRVKRVAFGSRRFAHYRIRALRRETQLGPTPDHHTSLKSDKPARSAR